MNKSDFSESKNWEINSDPFCVGTKYFLNMTDSRTTICIRRIIITSWLMHIHSMVHDLWGFTKNSTYSISSRKFTREQI